MFQLASKNLIIIVFSGLLFFSPISKLVAVNVNDNQHQLLQKTIGQQRELIRLLVNERSERQVSGQKVGSLLQLQQQLTRLLAENFPLTYPLSTVATSTNTNYGQVGLSPNQSFISGSSSVYLSGSSSGSSSGGSSNISTNTSTSGGSSSATSTTTGPDSGGETSGETNQPTTTPKLIFKINDQETNLSVKPGVTLLLSWQGADVSSCLASGAWTGEKKLVGQESFLATKQQQIFILTCRDTAGATIEKQILVKPITSELGMNLSFFNYYTTSLPFKNIFRQSMSWRLHDIKTGSNEAYPQNYLDENSYPLTLPAGKFISIGLLQGAGGHYPAGRYVALFDGAGELNFTGDASDVSRPDPAINRYLFTVDQPSNDGIQLQIRSMSQAIKNIRVMPIEFEFTEADNPWHPQFLANLSNFQVLRFMNWQDASSKIDVISGRAQGAGTKTIVLDAKASSQDDAYQGMLILVANKNWDRRLVVAYDGASRTATVSVPWTASPAGQDYYLRDYSQRHWSDRNRLSSRRQDLPKGMAVELMVDLANRLQIDPWFTMPTAASDDYVRQFARYVKNNLSPELKIYLEYSNETWNANYPGYDYAVARGAELGIGSGAFHAYRATQIFKIWNEVFAEDDLRADRQSSRLVRILASQNANPATGLTRINYAGEKLLAGVANPFTLKPTGEGRYRAADYADALAVTFYLGETLSGEVINQSSVDELFDLLVTETKQQMSPGGNRYQNIKQAKDNGLAILIYEGGTSLMVDSRIPYLRSSVESATDNELVLSNTYQVGTWRDNDLVSKTISVVAGRGQGQVATITAYDQTERIVSLSTAWSVVPDTSSRVVIQTAGQYKVDLVNRLPWVAELYQLAINLWREMPSTIIGSATGVWCAFDYAGQWDRYGRWGHLEYYDQAFSESPRWQALINLSQGR